MSTSILIFVVEDEETIQDLLDEALTDGGYIVQTASNAKQAIAKLDANGADFKALVTDVDLASGKLTGWDVARHAREITADLPVVYITGGQAHEWSSRGVPKSVLLTKPFAPAQVVTAVSQLINARSSATG